MIRSTMILLSLTLMVAGLLILADIGGEGPFCKPFRVDCLIANHEDLAAGIIGAAGALFAAWLLP